VNRLPGGAPNPTFDSTELHFDLSEQAQVELQIHDVQGRLVRDLASATLAPGRHAQYWDGRHARGREVAAGTYFARLLVRDRDGERSWSRKVTMRR
jgi:flagellar hook assembly protein FlgD